MTYWLAMILAPAIAGTSPMAQDRALQLEVSENDDQVVLTVLGNSPRTLHVSFTIEVTGSSRSKHSGSLTLAANEQQTLSTLKFNNSDGWCAKLIVEEEGQTPYEVTEGSCAD